jgi:hypothetical protein
MRGIRVVNAPACAGNGPRWRSPYRPVALAKAPWGGIFGLGSGVEPGENDALVISIAVCIDRIHEDEVREKEREGNRGFGGFGLQ